MFDQVGNYYLWFHISKKVIKSDKLEDKLNIDMTENCFIDGLKCQVYLRINAVEEVVEYISSLDSPDDQHHPINIVAAYILGIK